MEVANDDPDERFLLRRSVESVCRAKHPSLLSQSMALDISTQERDSSGFQRCLTLSKHVRTLLAPWTAYPSPPGPVRTRDLRQTVRSMARSCEEIHSAAGLTARLPDTNSRIAYPLIAKPRYALVRMESTPLASEVMLLPSTL
jgi:hypothetical protein